MMKTYQNHAMTDAEARQALADACCDGSAPDPELGEGSDAEYHQRIKDDVRDAACRKAEHRGLHTAC